MIRILNVTLRNFFSVGQLTQSVDLNSDNLTLVLGSNLDIGNEPDNTKNGVGKTALLNAISYGLYGVSLSNVKKSNLINKTNRKNMLVTVSFQKDNTVYRIERGRSPTFLRFFINDTEQEITDESQGDSRQTQEQIVSLLGMSHDLFKLLVALNTYSEPFLSMRAADQRNIIEQLLGVTALSEKADELRAQIKQTKESIQVETASINALESSNKRIQQTIENLKLKQVQWHNSRSSQIAQLQASIVDFSQLDIEKELELHDLAQKYTDLSRNYQNIVKKYTDLDSDVDSYTLKVKKLTKQLESLTENTCFTCGQPVHSDNLAELRKKTTNELENAQKSLESAQSALKTASLELDSAEKPQKPQKPFYNTVREAYDHQNNVNLVKETLANKQEETDPYAEQINELLSNALSPISWDTVNELDRYREHQEFLLKLLTNKDSFIRKKIVDQNLAYLNSRLTHYLAQLGLPHLVSFQNDLSVNITMLGQDLDFDNLSRGERTRLILGLSFAFRDVWEHLEHDINLLFIDELLDSGLDGAGIENALGVLKQISRDRKKNVFLISHREGLIGRVNNTLMVIKENGFTRFESGEYEENDGRYKKQE